MRFVKIAVLCVLCYMAVPAAAQEIKTDFDHSTNFSSYRTYMWIKEPKTENPLNRERIMNAVNAQLQAKGLRLVTSGADLGVSANTATKQQQTLQSFYDDFPGWGWRRWGPVTTTVETYTVGTLVVDLFDTKTKQVKWWGKATDTVSEKPEKNAKKLDEAVQKIFKDYPPKSEKAG